MGFHLVWTEAEDIPLNLNQTCLVNSSLLQMIGSIFPSCDFHGNFLGHRE